MINNTYTQAIETVSCYDDTVLDEAIGKLFDTLHVADEIGSDTRVLLKPNLLGPYDPFFPVITNPAVTAATVRWLQTHGVTDITIADSPGGSVSKMPGFTFDGFYRKTGYSFLAQQGAQLNTDTGWQTVPTPPGCILKSFNLLNAVCEADYIINLPKLKTHNKTVISFGVKNLFGCVPDLQKPAFHAKYPRIADFANMLVELAMTVKPALTLIDAVEIMEHNGPVAGKKRQLGLLLAAKDVFSQDRFLADLLGINTEAVDLLRIAQKKGLTRSAEVVSHTFLPGTQVMPLLLPDIFTAKSLSERASSLYRMAADKLNEKLIVQTPCVNTDKCKKCMLCVRSCPVGAIAETAEAPVVNTHICISCLCCAEVCTHGGISVKNKIKRHKKT